MRFHWGDVFMLYSYSICGSVSFPSSVMLWHGKKSQLGTREKKQHTTIDAQSQTESLISDIICLSRFVGNVSFFRPIHSISLPPHPEWNMLGNTFASVKILFRMFYSNLYKTMFIAYQCLCALRFVCMNALNMLVCLSGLCAASARCRKEFFNFMGTLRVHSHTHISLYIFCLSFFFSNFVVFHIFSVYHIHTLIRRRLCQPA